MIKNNLKHEVTALEKSRRKSILKGYLITAITYKIIIEFRTINTYITINK